MFDIATTRISHSHARNAPDVRPWIWPLPKIDDRTPTIRSLTCGVHPYAELAYEGGDPALRFVPVFAVQDGVITFAGKVTSRCEGKTFARYSMCLDHAGGWSTRYGDLEHMFSVCVDRFARRRKQRVRAGDILGYASRSPLRLPFELWRADDDHYGPVAPEQHMRNWLVLPWSDTPTARRQAEPTTNPIAA